MNCRCAAVLFFVLILANTNLHSQIPGAPDMGPQAGTGNSQMATAIRCYLDGDWDGAIDIFTRILKQDRKNAEAYHGRGRAYAAKNELDKAIMDFRSVIKVDPGGTDAYYAHVLLSGIFQLQKDPKRATKELDSAILIKPKESRTYIDRAKLREEIGDSKGAIADYDMAISLQPRVATYYDHRGMLRFTLKDYTGAIADFDKALERQSRFHQVWVHRGDAKKMLGDYEGAMKDYDKALDISGDYAQGYVQRGLLKLILGRPAEAQADFDEALKFDPSLEASLQSEKAKLNR
jgi:tetratricopeptide (TPR) repeat protein